MAGRVRGVFVGVNSCLLERRIPTLFWAEQDAQQVCEVLTDQTMGVIPPDSATILVGRSASAGAVKKALRLAALATEPSDVLVVYFAGHGLLPPWEQFGEPYLVTSDLTLAEIREQPDSGLRMGYLRRDVFDVVRGTSILMLDCCHAGGFPDAQSSVPTARSLYHAFSEFYEGPLSRHSALLACPRNTNARERDDLRHGVFTHHLLTAMRGAAAGPDGAVTIERVAEHVKRQQLDPKPGFFAHGYGPPTILTRPTPPQSHKSGDGLDKSPAGAVEISALSNSLDGAIESLMELIRRAFSAGRLDAVGTGTLPDAGRLALIGEALDARGAAVATMDASSARLNVTWGEFDQADVTGVLQQLSRRIAGSARANLGYVCVEDDGRRTLAVPLWYEPENRITCLVVAQPSLSALDIGEPLALTLRALWRINLWHDPMLAELLVLTELRESVGRLPLSCYNYAFQRYRQLLADVIMVFEPIMLISKNPTFVGVHSWEALARRTEVDRSAPMELLDAARPWGDQFVAERDRIIARKAILSYAQAHETGSYNVDVPVPLSVNVAVRSLLSSAYADEVASAIDEAGIGPDKIVLEISERDDIAPAPDESWLPTPIEFFQARLVQLSRRLQVSFAIDDFGIGHSSLDRLAKLTLTQIKVDREVLHHPLALDELLLVDKMAKHILPGRGAGHSRPVILEGFDEHAPVTLADIYQCGIRYVQGYVTKHIATPELRPLHQDVRNYVAAEVRRSL